MTFASRMLRNTLLLIAVAASLSLLIWAYGLSLRDPSFLSGWLLLAGVGILAAYNLRKKLPILPLMSVSAWLQLHVYVGWAVILLFLLHTSVRWPSGGLETGLWLLFVSVAASGVVGLVLSRVLPGRMRLHGERIIFERIPGFRAELAREVEELAMESIGQTSSDSIADFYVNRLQPFLKSPGNVWAHLVGSNATIQHLRRELRTLERYLGSKGRETLDEIEWRLEAKDNLDRQYALQLCLKGWLFVHVPLTYGLILVAIVHAVVAYAFDGGSL